MTNEAIQRHEKEWHGGEQKALGDMQEDLTYLLDDLYGEKHKITGNRPGGRLTNGGIKVKIPTAVLGFLGTIALALASIAVAVITKL